MRRSGEQTAPVTLEMLSSWAVELLPQRHLVLYGQAGGCAFGWGNHVWGVEHCGESGSFSRWSRRAGLGLHTTTSENTPSSQLHGPHGESIFCQDNSALDVLFVNSHWALDATET